MIRKKEELARMEEVGEDDFHGAVGTGQSTSQAPLHLKPSGRSDQGQGPNTGEAMRERRDGEKGSATAGLLMPVPNVNKRKNKNGGGKERLEQCHQGDRMGRGCHKRKAELIETDLNSGGEIGKVCEAMQRSGGNQKERKGHQVTGNAKIWKNHKVASRRKSQTGPRRERKGRGSQEAKHRNNWQTKTRKDQEAADS